MLDTRILSFLNLCETKSYTKTAKTLNITQPTVTQHIQFLESKYQSKLVEYSGRTLKLTDKGEQLRKYALAMKANNQKIEHEMLTPIKNKEIIFGCTLTIGEFIMPEKITNYVIENPDTNITMLVENTKSLIKKLEEGIIDFAVIEGYFDKEKYGYELLQKAKYIGVCSSEYLLADTKVSFQELMNHRIIVREKNSGTRNILETILYEKNLSINSFSNCIEIGNFNAIKELVKNKLGITFAYEEVVQKELEDGILVQLQLEDFKIIREFNIVYLKDAFLMEANKAFWNYIK